ncbi:hypothetical protein FisN_15Hh250 [Fistulifera solaris]|uniref:Uncharacterized protein n=1 Tax=Fistulifera solaris TaxID=1519565 RepID=A0A1Z5JG91_FISSO|nr:hypothetical protein FisN_15Hh250 [Fistulifera solaris]|eukprot:GAX12771.1 hypothetical protein FisN_15Hh250 [Fistulifera solaris]
MPRGSEAKLRRRNQRKDEDKQDLNAIFGDPNGEETDEVPLPPRMKNAAPVDDHDSEEEAPPAMPKKKKGKAVPIGVPPPSSKGGIKRAPLILLILMTGTTLLPALLYAGDFLSSFLAKSNITGGLGYRMGIGHVPRKRVLSFYEKHAPEKVNDVPHILSKYYGDYPKLIKSLERKYQDYGYFMGWEEDEAPMKLMTEYLNDIYSLWIKQWNRHAPQALKTAARNAKYNIMTVYKKGRKIWKAKVWPMLEPIFGVPDGADKQKRQDAAEARKRRKTDGGNKPRRKNREFRDDVDDS